MAQGPSDTILVASPKSEIRILRFVLSEHSFLVINSSTTRVPSIVTSRPVCLSVRSHNSKTVRPEHRHVPAACGRGSVLLVAICYVLPVLWMTSRFHIMALYGTSCVFLSGDRIRQA